MNHNFEVIKNKVERTIERLERTTYQLFNAFLSVLKDLSQIDDDDLIRALRVRYTSGQAIPLTYAFIKQLQFAYKQIEKKSLDERVHIVFNKGRIYKALQALTHFRSQYYQELTTNNFDLDFLVASLAKLQSIHNRFIESTVDISPVADQVLAFLADIHLALESDSFVLDTEVQEFIEDKSMVITFLSKSFASFNEWFIDAAVLFVDISAREQGLYVRFPSVSERARASQSSRAGLLDYDSNHMLKQLMTANKKLATTLLNLKNYAHIRDVMFSYKKVISNFYTCVATAERIRVSHKDVVKIRALDQTLQKSAPLTGGVCYGLTIYILDNDPSIYIRSVECSSLVKTYTDLDTIKITHEIAKEHKNQLSREQMESGKSILHKLGTPIIDRHCENLINELYKIAKYLLRNANEKDVRILINLNNKHGGGHTVGFYAYKFDGSKNIGCLFIDSNYGIFRFKLTNSKNVSILNWFLDLFLTAGYLNWIKEIILFHVYPKSLLKSLFVAGVEDLRNGTEAKVFAKLRHNLAESGYAAKDDSKLRQKVLLAYQRMKRGDDSVENSRYMLESYKNIVNKSLLDHFQLAEAINRYQETFSRADDNFKTHLELLDNIAQIASNIRVDEVAIKFNICINLCRALISESIEPGTGSAYYKSVVDLINSEILLSQDMSEDDKASLAEEMKIAQISLNLDEYCKKYASIHAVTPLTNYLLSHLLDESAINEVRTYDPYLAEVIKVIPEISDYENRIVVDDTSLEFSLIARRTPNMKVAYSDYKLPIMNLFYPSPQRRMSFPLPESEERSSQKKYKSDRRLLQ